MVAATVTLTPSVIALGMLLAAIMILRTMLGVMLGRLFRAMMLGGRLG